MFNWLTGRVNVRHRLTNAGFQRWMRLTKKLGLPFERENEVLRRAVWFYARGTDLKGNPLFIEDRVVEFVSCDLRDYTSAPEGPWAYEKRLQMSSRAWRKWERLRARTGDPDVSVMIERALQLCERLVDGHLPTLYTVDDEGEFIEIGFII